MRRTTFLDNYLYPLSGSGIGGAVLAQDDEEGDGTSCTGERRRREPSCG